MRQTHSNHTTPTRVHLSIGAAKESAVGVRTIHRIEAQDGLPNATAGNLKLLRETLQAAGIEFIGDAGEGPGVRLWSNPNQS